MQLKRLSGSGFLAYPHPFTIDFSTLGTLVAVTGPNGSGKSTLLELFPAALFRELPTRGAIKDVAVGRNTFVEAEIVNGRRYTIRQSVDAFNGKAEVSVLDEGGNAVLTSGKVSEFDKWAETHLPAPSVFYSSLFAAQKSEGLLGMKKGDRKAVIIRVLGLERLELMAERARKYKQNVETTLATNNAALNELGDTEGDIAFWRNRRFILGADAETAQAALDTAELELKKEQEDSERREGQRARYTLALQERGGYDAQKAALAKRRDDIQERLRNNRALAGDADEINAAVTRIAELDKLIKAAEETNHALRVEEASIAAKDRDLIQRTRTAAQRIKELDEAIRRADLVLTEADVIQEAHDTLAEWQAKADEATIKRDAAQTALDNLRSTHLRSKETRIRDLRGYLSSIAYDEELDDSPGFAVSGLQNDDALETKEKNFAADEARLQSELNVAGAELMRGSTHLVARQRLAARIGELESARALKIQSETEKATFNLDALAAEREQFDRESQDWCNRWTESQTEITTLHRERTLLAPAAGKADVLARTQERIAELERQEKEVNDELDTLDLTIAGLPPLPDEPGPAIDLRPFTTAVETARQRLGEAATEVAITKSRLEETETRNKRRLELLADRNRLQAESADWTRLAMDLGRDGLQALEIDAAGPELTTLANDLLRACGDTRFSVDIVTTKTSADGKRELEGCEIMVSDSVKGTVQEGETLSGGEAVFVGEAVRSAVTMMGCRRNGVAAPTLVRDESGAALDPERAPQYMAMLRITADIVGASNVLLVSHNPDLLALADSIVRVGGGKVVV
jgi:DNA repair protein SbcC/Rad50